MAHQVKNLPAMRGRPGFDPWGGKIPWRRERLPTPVFWPGEFLEKSMGSQSAGHTEGLSLHLTFRGKGLKIESITNGQ